ncbi:uncharacterized protein ACHE_51056A [Aspergillus chevalieri]|uniref:Uncharacterized protein n=1 Tax=Aspergillus chevalieri TaxID=182096 RepID=A0A7R7VTG8_ASPCH|nr:uncharacterized protein ACHE_51056A [Aspergillus chevalieri]BCR89858.1 hypothetical protein ACHE_51056A [Aspergillus chevalieri]
MGYTHYYPINTNSPEWKAIWPQLIDNVHKIISRSGVHVSGPDEGHDGEEIPPPIVDVNEDTYLNGVGYDGYQPFVIGRKGYPGCTKTVRKPYDVVVTCILLRAYMLAPSACGIGSDGFWIELKAARSLYEGLFGEKPKSRNERSQSIRYIALTVSRAWERF